jgi:hypothetical protein
MNLHILVWFVLAVFLMGLAVTVIGFRVHGARGCLVFVLGLAVLFCAVYLLVSNF